MQIPSIVKFTAVNFFKFVMFITVMFAIAGVVIAVMEISEHYLGHALWGAIPLFVAVALFFSYLQARQDVVTERRRNQSIAERLSRED